ncbi:MAG TPA: DUF3024 domain-containing protein [Geobacteraceae bacterium]
MALSEFERKRIEKVFAAYCEQKVPHHARDLVRVEFGVLGNEVTLFETRPHCLDKGSWIAGKVARFRKDPATNCWQLYCADRNGNWRLFRPYPISIDIEKLLAAVEKDATGIFWG